MSRTVVELKKVYKAYIQGGNLLLALRGITTRFLEGEFTSIMGPSGSGKTTLLNVIGGLDRITKGELWIDGVNTVYLSEEELTRLRGEKIGFVFQFFNLIPVLNALENVMLPMLLVKKYSKAEAKRRAMRLLREVGLADRAKHKPSQLSGGQQQRVAIARALANNPSLVLADEPTGNLDSKTGAEIMRLLKKLNLEEKKTFIIVTHDPDVAAITRRRLEIRDGKIVKDETVGYE